jgi:DHA1 family tetracycline resistance protein-like MFS transporter
MLRPSSSPREPLKTEASRKPLYILLGVIVIDLIGFGVAIPVLPYLAKEQQEGGLVLGLLMASYAAMQFLFAPVWGRLSDRIGRKPVILLTIAGTSACLVLLGLSDSIVWMFVARTLGGVFGANISVATAYIGDMTEPEERTRWMGLVGASFGVGFTLGPVIGGALSVYGYGTPMLFAAGLAAANLVFASIVLHEPPHRADEPEVMSDGPALASSAILKRLAAINFIFTLAVCQLEGMFALFMFHRFAYEPWDVAQIMFLMALVMMGIQGGGIHRLAKRFGEKKLLVYGTTIMAIAFLAVPYVDSVALLIGPLVLSAIGRAVSQPSMLSLVSLEGTPSTRGAVMGRFQSASSAARTIGPMVAGLLYDYNDGWPFAFAGVLMLLAIPLSIKLPESITPEAA